MIQIDEKYFINADEHQFTLIEKFVNKTGKKIGEERFKPQGYYPNVSSALSAYLKIKTREYVSKNDCTIKQAIEEMKRIEEYIKNIVCI